MINHFILSPLTVLVRTNREDSVNYLRINADLSRPETVAMAAANAFYLDIRDNLDIGECDPGSAGDAWRENDCEIVGIAEGHFNIATSGCDTVASLCSYLQFAIDAEKPPRVVAVPAALGAPYGNDRSQAAVNAFAQGYGQEPEDTQPLLSVFVGRRESEVDYDTYLSVVEAVPDVAGIYSAVIDDYDMRNGVGSWDDHGCFIVGIGAGEISMAWRPAGLEDAEIAAVAADVLGGAK
ncbi:hypothetical protein XAP3_0071 [Xanthomonas phage XAP3]|nr:hypothetical protein XAP3_0071 [Xanthomonas phage XAP3]